MRKTKDRRDDLPAKFSDAEREAYKWLYDCQVDGWSVDLATKKVFSLDGGYFNSLVEFREKLEAQEDE